MPNELERYNHLRYENNSSDEEGFVDFLFENSESSAPEVSVDDAWASLQKKIDAGKTKSYSWLRIAASVTILLGVSIFIWTLSTTPDQVNVASADEKINVTFPDGSSGVLNTNSSFSFLEKFGNERVVAFEGEAYFDIKKSEKPFLIEMGDVTVRVLGTAFNLVTSNEEVELIVERGLVAFVKEDEQTKVAAGLKAVFNKADNSVEITENPSTNIATWIDGKLEFDDTSFETVIQDLESYFEVSFQVENQLINSCKVTATFDKNSLSEVIETLELMLGVQMEETQGKIIVSGKGC
ncbi:MAG: FecR domain-containing protein [Cyclobacteriaceae bacterium]